MSFFVAMEGGLFSMMMKIGAGFVFLPKKGSSGLVTICMDFA